MYIPVAEQRSFVIITNLWSLYEFLLNISIKYRNANNFSNVLVSNEINNVIMQIRDYAEFSALVSPAEKSPLPLQKKNQQQQQQANNKKKNGQTKTKAKNKACPRKLLYSVKNSKTLTNLKYCHCLTINYQVQDLRQPPFFVVQMVAQQPVSTYFTLSLSF